MMLVKLKNNWFSPSEKEEYAKGLNLSVSGRRYKKGVHEIPEHLRDFLPPDSEIMDGAYVSYITEGEKVLKKKKEEEVDVEALDLARLDSDRHAALLEEADATLKSYKKKEKK